MGGGYRSFFAFWMGGASALSVAPPVPSTLLQNVLFLCNVGRMMNKG